MFYLLFIPFIILGLMISIAANWWKVKTVNLIGKIIMWISIILFIYTYGVYNGYDIIKEMINLVKSWLKF